jgi:heme-degrading monooxygenase HmoA
MYMRFVHGKYKRGTESGIRAVYENVVIPRLQSTPGCLCVCLIKSESHQNEGISLTLWDSREHADAYEKSGLYQELLSSVKPYLSDSAEWKVQLSKDLELEYTQVAEEPVVKSYSLAARTEGDIPIDERSQTMYLRILSVKIQPGKMSELENIYTEKILPALRSVPGCRFAYLTEGIEEQNEAICVSIWDSKEAADEYEASGELKRLLKKVEHTFSSLYQWKMALEKKYAGGQVVTSDDLSLGEYSLIAGKHF